MSSAFRLRARGWGRSPEPGRRLAGGRQPRARGSSMLSVMLSALLLVAQVAPRDASPPRDRAGTGVISGRVVAADTSVPLRRVHVTLQPVGDHDSRTPRRVATDSEGRFAFTAVPAGAYRL